MDVSYYFTWIAKGKDTVRQILVDNASSANHTIVSDSNVIKYHRSNSNRGQESFTPFIRPFS